MRYYISDCHFFHRNMVKKMDQRPFSTLEEMHEHMIRQWNKRVRKNDEVVILGDFSYGTGEETNALLQELPGKLYLIIGNHDRRFLEDKAFNPKRFVWIRDYTELNDNHRTVVLSHYPIICYNGQYRRDPEGNPKRYMLYGHVHNTKDEELVNRFIQEMRQEYHLRRDGEKETIPCNMINCFCMFSDYTPLTLDEWIEVDSTRRMMMNQESEEKEGGKK